MLFLQATSLPSDYDLKSPVGPVSGPLYVPPFPPPYDNIANSILATDRGALDLYLSTGTFQAVSTVALPGSALLYFSGLMGLAGLARKKTTA